MQLTTAVLQRSANLVWNLWLERDSAFDLFTFVDKRVLLRYGIKIMPFNVRTYKKSIYLSSSHRKTRNQIDRAVIEGRQVASDLNVHTLRDLNLISKKKTQGRFDDEKLQSQQIAK